MEHESDGDTNYHWCTRNDPHWLGMRARRVGNRGTNQNNPNYSIAKIDQNTEKSLGDFWRLAVTHQQTIF